MWCQKVFIFPIQSSSLYFIVFKNVWKKILKNTMPKVIHLMTSEQEDSDFSAALQSK
jgi:hypothetical protein